MGGVACPAVLSPQQATVPSLFTAQVWLAPALTAVKVPAGGVACPELFKPQQATVPSVLTPQVKLLPALTAGKVPVGGVAGAVAGPKPVEPEQSAVQPVFAP